MVRRGFQPFSAALRRLGRHPRMLALTLVVLAALGLIMGRTAWYGQRASDTLAALAREANDKGHVDAAMRYALAGLNGFDAPFIGHNPQAARTELLRAVVASRRIAEFSPGPGGGFADKARFSPDGTRLVVVNSRLAGLPPTRLENRVQILDAASGRILFTIPGETVDREDARPRDAFFAPDGEHLLVVGDGLVRRYDAMSGRHLMSHDVSVGSRDDAPFVEAGVSGEHLVGYDGAWFTTFFGSNSGPPLNAWKLDLPRGRCRAPEFSPDGRRVLAGCPDGVVRVWNARDGRLLSQFRRDNVAAYYSPSGAQILAPSRRETAILDAASGRSVMRLPGLAETSANGDFAAFSPDGRRVAIADSRNAATRIWDIERGRETAVLVWGRNVAKNVAFSPDGARLVTTAGVVRIWDAGDEPDPARLVHAPGARAPLPLNRLSASALQRYACALLDASHRARRFSSREFRTALAINESLPQDVCDAPRHWERVLAAHGRNVSDFRGLAASVRNIGGVRVTYRYEGVVEGVSALWIADGTGRAARRDDLRVHGFEESRIDTYWNGARTYIRADGQPVATLPQLPFDFLQRHIPQPAPAEEANVLPRDLSAGYRRIGERTIMGRRCTLWRKLKDAWTEEMCIWRGLPLYESLREQVVEDGRDDKPEGAFILREAIEVVENEPIPEDLAALAVMVD